MFLLGFRHVRTRSNGFSKIHAYLNLGPNVTFGSSCSPDFEPNFVQVQRSSGSNRGSEPNYGSTKENKKTLSLPVDNKGYKSYSMILKRSKPIDVLSRRPGVTGDSINEDRNPNIHNTCPEFDPL